MVRRLTTNTQHRDHVLHLLPFWLVGLTIAREFLITLALPLLIQFPACPSGFILSNSDGSPTSDERAFFCSQPDATCTPPLILQPNNTCANNVVCVPPEVLDNATNTCIFIPALNPKSTPDPSCQETTNNPILHLTLEIRYGVKLTTVG